MAQLLEGELQHFIVQNHQARKMSTSLLLSFERILQELADYWEHNFDWKKAEAMMNAFEHYKLQLNGIDLHFIHERSEDPNAIPLLFSHGWPGSFVEAFKIIRKLTHPGSTANHQQSL